MPLEKSNEISFYVDHFVKAMGDDMNHRYRSFDLCYCYFRENISNVAHDNIEESCMRLWAYLASWGMLRGSSELLQLNPKALTELVEYIDVVDNRFWDIDVDTYTHHNNLDDIIKVYKKIELILKEKIRVTPTITLITKIMLGVFGNIPAFDQYFMSSFKEWLHANKLRMPTRFTIKMLEWLHKFYEEYETQLKGVPTVYVKRFDGSCSQFIYSKAKIIDMWGFTKGIEKYKQITK